MFGGSLSKGAVEFLNVSITHLVGNVKESRVQGSLRRSKPSKGRGSPIVSKTPLPVSGSLDFQSWAFSGLGEQVLIVRFLCSG